VVRKGIQSCKEEWYYAVFSALPHPDGSPPRCLGTIEGTHQTLGPPILAFSRASLTRQTAERRWGVVSTSFAGRVGSNRSHSRVIDRRNPLSVVGREFSWVLLRALHPCSMGFRSRLRWLGH